MKKLLPNDFRTWHWFSLQFLARFVVDSEWPWNILWTDKSYFYLDNSMNTHSCLIWESENPCSTLQIVLQLPKLIVCYWFAASFILGPYFFKELSASCSMFNHRTDTGQWCVSLLKNKIMTDLRACLCLSHTILCKMEPLYTLAIMLCMFWKDTSQKNISSVATFLILSLQTSIHETFGFGGIWNIW